MRFSGLVIAAILLVPATLFSQHTSGASGSSSPSSSSTSVSSSSSSSSSGSHASGSSSSASSGGSRGSSSASSGGSRGSNSGGSHSSASSASSHNSNSSASHVTSKRGTPPPAPPSTRSASTKEHATPEKKSVFSFFRHPFRKPKPVQSAKVKRPVPCRKKPCSVCPPGESLNRKGVCAAPPVVIAHDRNQCRAGTAWNGVTCADYYEDPCASARMAVEELRGIQAQMESACASNSSGQECSDLKQRYEQAQQSYESSLRASPTSCRTALRDPHSLGSNGQGNPSAPKRDITPAPPK